MTAKELNLLVKQLQDGNMSVFDDIYYETKNLVYYTILSILKDSHLSEDLMQETYLKALEKIHSFKPKANFKSWIVTIARNLSINEYNRRKKSINVDIQTDEILLGSVQNNSEQELIVEEILNTLKETEREIVLLHILGDLKHREISKILDIPLGTVTWTYNQAIKKLRNEMEKR